MRTGKDSSELVASHHDLHLGRDSRTGRGMQKRYPWRQEGFRYALIEGRRHGDAVGGPSGLEWSIFGFLWLVLNLRNRDKKNREVVSYYRGPGHLGPIVIGFIVDFLISFFFFLHLFIGDSGLASCRSDS